MIRKIILAFFLGSAFTLWRMPYDPFFQQFVAHQFTEFFNNAFDCKLSCARVRINLWIPSLILEEVHVVSQEGQGWSWSATKYSTHCSWWHIWSNRTLDLDMCFENFSAESDYKEGGGLSITPHVKKIVLGKPLIPVVIEQLKLQNASLRVNKEGQQVACLNWTSCSYDRGGILYSSLQLKNGSISMGGFELHQLEADINAELAPNPHAAGFTMAASCAINALNTPLLYSITASWLHQKGNLDISGSDATMIHMDLDEQKQMGNFCWDIPLATLARLALNISELPGTLCGSGFFSFADRFRMHSNYACKSSYKDKNIAVQGSIQLDDNALKSTGEGNGISYDLVFDAKNYYLKEGAISYENKPVVSVTENQHDVKNYTLKVHLEVANELVQNWCGLQMIAKGDLQCQLTREQEKWHVDLSTQKLFFLIPNSFYSITDLKSALDIYFEDRTIKVASASAALDSGVITCCPGIIQCDSEFDFINVHLPFQIKKVPLKVDPSIHGLLNGQLVVSKKKSKPVSLQGKVLIAQGRINPLQAAHLITKESTKQLPLEIECGITLATQTPITLEAPIVEGKLVSQVQVKNTLSNPHISGKCTVQQGIIHLPYKPLYLEKAEFTLNANTQIPFINLLGTSKIKRFDVMVQVVGPLDKYQIILSSDPYLKQEEIVALLLSGNPKSAPAILLPTITSQACLDYFKYKNKNSWFSFFDYVRLVPHFDDQSARGGIRAAFEIMVTEQLTALIQKNFSLTEDTRFQVEYAISDDIAIRATRDERRDLNAEIEMRWKF